MSSKKNISSLKLLNLVTGPINFYSRNLIPHCFVVGVPMLAYSVSQIVSNNIYDPEQKKVVTGFMIFNIIMFLLITFKNNIFSKTYNVLLFLVYIVFPSVVIALLNLDEIPHDTVSKIMFVQSVFTIVFTWAAVNDY